MDRDILGQRLAVDDEHRHLMFGIEFQIVGGAVVAFAHIDRSHREGRTSLGERDIRRESASDGRIIEHEIHKRFLPRLIYRAAVVRGDGGLYSQKSCAGKAGRKAWPTRTEFAP